MDFDEVTRTHESANNSWNRRLGKYNTAGIEKLASKYNNGITCDCVEAKSGSFNMCFKVLFDDKVAWTVRFPIPGKVMYPEEKIYREVAVMRFIKDKTRIPIPKVVAYGTALENHDPEMGPFIITDWVNGVSLESVMEEQPRPEWGPVLRADIEDSMLYKIYRQMAKILLELSMHNFDKIGALSEVKSHDGHHSWTVSARPMTLKMNEIERGGYVIMGDHALPPFSTVTEYMKYLVQQNVDHLHLQRNSIDDADDARRKHILRQQATAVFERFVSKEFDSGPFKLVCDDLRPHNVIVDPKTLEIVALIDLEWTYAAPYQFLFSPPLWLILENPATWTSYGIASYKKRLELFIKSLADEEEMLKRQGYFEVSTEQRMSTLMCHSMDDGKFWFGSLLRESYNFDGDVLWPNVEHFLQSQGLNIHKILNEIDDRDMEALVERKVEDLRQYKAELKLLENEERN